MTTTRLADEMASLAWEVVESYEARVAAVEQIMESTHQMLDAFRQQREQMRVKLRETFARSASLRRRDFDSLIQKAIGRQEVQEKTVQENVRGYLAEQRALAGDLKQALKSSSGGGSGSLQVLLGRIRETREKREEEVKSLLSCFQRDHEKLLQTMGELLTNGDSVKAKDLKATLSVLP